MVRLREVLTSPTDAFAAHEEPSLFAPIVIVVAYGAVALVTVAPILVAIADRLPETIAIEVAVGAQEISAPGTPVAIMALGIPLVMLLWGVVSVVTYGGARLLGGEAGFASTAAFVGWGFLPKLVSGIVIATIALIVAVLDPDLTFVELLLGSRQQIEINRFSVEGPVGPLIPVIFVVEAAASLLTAYVWYGGLAGRHALSRRRAIALTVVLFVLFNGV